jgi:hypothetical protein
METGMSIIQVKIEHTDGRGWKTYRYDTAKGQPEKCYANPLDAISGGSLIAQRTDQQLLDGLNDVVCRSMYPIPYNRWSRAVALAWLTEMERRGLLEFDAHEKQPTISFGLADEEGA